MHRVVHVLVTMAIQPFLQNSVIQSQSYAYSMMTSLCDIEAGSFLKCHKEAARFPKAKFVKMAVAVSMFRWLDLLEKEFDKAFVNLDVLLGGVDPDQAEITFEGRQKMTALSSSFAQLAHKAQTVFQANAKLEVNKNRPV